MYIEVVDFEIKGQCSPLSLDAWSFNAFPFMFFFLISYLQKTSKKSTVVHILVFDIEIGYGFTI